MKTAAELRAELARAQRHLEAATPAMDGDPALARLGPVALRQHHARTDTQLDRYGNALAAVRRAEDRLARAEAREAEAARPRLRQRDVWGARGGRTRHGGHKGGRVNGGSVTV